ncbi:cytochrome bc complex cytochrome b subunit [Nonomuraea sp. NN258]|uniref:cytochrome b n=1 Tax=Nonomuraea antri TaxID=2730852 RepID=UPI001569B22C|nr:cytochrome bc complex cytochrome b subunit [Nonomuraea antri]NRQ38719.1 cytochrome bc complex cytochrome b subunit [Nonomuraea antri]
MATPTKPGRPSRPGRRARFVAGSAKAGADTAGYLDDRLGLGRWLRPNLRKLFPSHWSFLLGELALYSFVMLVLTGTFLTLFYKPNPDVAFASVWEISREIRGGLLMRQLHHWSATVFVLSIVAHLCRVYFTGAFRKPRELTWMLGVLLFGLALFESFLGVSLQADPLAYAGLRQAQGLLLSVPLVGTYLSAFVFDGAFPGNVIPRLFVTHVLLVPGILLAVVPLHALILTWRQKHTERRATGDERRVTGGPFFPYFAVKNGATALFTIAVISLLATFVMVNPFWRQEPGALSSTPPSAQPFWYSGVLDGALRLVPGWEIEIGGYPLMVGLWIPMLILGGFFTVLFCYPFLERRFTGDTRYHHLLDRPSQAPVRTALGFAVITFFLVLWAPMWVSELPPVMRSAPAFPGQPPPVPPALLTVPHDGYVLIITVLRVAVFVLPPLAYAVALAVCRRRSRT